MSIFSRIKELFTGGSSRKTESRRRPTTAYRSRGSRLSSSSSSFSSRTFGNPSGMSLEERLEKRRKENEEKQKKTTATLASISKSATSGAKAVEKATQTGTQRAIEKMGQKSASTSTTTNNKAKAPKPKAKPRTEEEIRQNARENAQKKLESISKKTGKALRVKSPEEMVKSGDYEYRPKAKNMNTPSAGDRSTVRPTLQGYKKQMSNPAFRVAQSATRGYAGGSTLGILEPLLRGNKDDKTEQAIEKYYQANKSRLAEGAGNLAGTFATFGVTGGGASKTLGKVAPKTAEKVGSKGAEWLAKNSKMLKTAEKEAIKRFGTEGATKEVIEQIAKRRGREIMAELGKDASINVTTGLLNDVVRASTEHELFSDDWWKEMRDNALINIPLGVATSAVPAFRVGKNFDDALDVVAPRAGAMADEALERVRPEVGEATANVERIAQDAVEGRAIRDAIEAEDPQAKLLRLNAELEDVQNEITARRNSASVEELEELNNRWNSLYGEREAMLNPVDQQAVIQADAEALDPQTIQEEALNEVKAQMPELNTVEPTATAEAPKLKAETPKKAKASAEESIEKMVAKRSALKKEKEDLVQGIKDEHGSINPNYKNLTPEQRASVTERKKRIQKIDRDVESLSKSITETRKANPSTNGKYASKYADDSVPTEELKEARKGLKEEFSELRKEVRSAEKKLANGDKDVDVELLEKNRKRLSQLGDDLDAIDRRLGTKPVVDGRTKEAKANSETKPKPVAKAEAKAKAEPKVDVEPKAETKVGTEAKPERTYKDVDLKRYVKKKDRPLLESRISELTAEKNQLEALGKEADSKRIEEIGAEISEMERALALKKNQKVKFEDPEKVKAQKLAEETKKNAEANANGKPIPEVKETKAKAEKPKKELTPEQQAKEEAKKRARAEKRLEREFDEVHREHTRLTNNNEDVGTPQSVKTAFAVATERKKKQIVKDGRAVLKDFAESGMTSSDNKSIFSYQRLNRARQDELVEAGYKRVTEDPKAVFKKLKSKVDAMDTMSLEDIADTVGIQQYYADIGREIPEEVEDVLTKVVTQGQTDHAQLLKVSDLILRRYSPNYRKKLMRRDIEKFREIVCNSSSEKDWEKTLASLDKKFGVDGYLDKKLDELKAVTDPKEFKKEYTALCRDIFRNTEPTMWDVANLIRHSFMLGSNKTALNNIFGNLSMRGMYSISDKLTVLGERGLESHQNKKIAQLAKEQNSLRDKLATLTEGTDEFKKVEAQIEELTNQIQANRVTRTTEFLKNKDLKKLSRQLKEGTVMSKVDEAVGKNRNYDDVEFAELFDNNTHDAVEEAMGDTKYGFHSDKGIDLKVKDATTTGGKLKRVVAKGASFNSKRVGFKLNEPDRWFVERNYRDSFARYLQANGITSAEAWKAHPDIIEKASAHAMDVALENTYKKNTRLVKVLESQRAKGYRKGSNIARKAVTMGMDAELPYLKVPANMVVNALKYSPIGALKSAGDMAVAIHKGDVDALTKSVNELSKGLTGTGLFAIGYYTSVRDQEDEDSIGFIAHARDELKEYNVRGNSFMVGGHNYNIANLGMGATQALMGARYAELQNEKGGAPTSILDDVDSVMQAFETVFDVEADTSLMENALGIFDVISNQGDYEMTASERAKNLGAKIVSDYIGQYTNPSSLRAIGRGTTSADLDTGVKKGEETTKTQRMIERNRNSLVSSVPVLNEKVLPHKVDRHGNLINERKTTGDKAKAVLQNYNDPFSRRKVHIPEADKVELSIKDDKGKPYQPPHFDEDREYKAQIGEKKYAKVIDLTPKEREMAGRAYKTSGYDMAYNLVTARSGWFGDSHGDRAQQILREIPEDEEKAREYLYNTPEFKNASDYEKRRMMDTLYDKRLGRGRSANYEVYVNQQGNDEGEFKFQNDLNSNKQGKYYDNNLEQYGITKAKWAEIIENAEYESHKYTDGLNKDTINSAYKYKKALLETEGLSDEARIAAYQAIRGKRNMFGWYDWDGKTLKGYRRYRRRRWRRWHRWGGSSKKAKVPAPKAIKASQFTKGEALVSKKKSSGNTTNVNPKLERVKAKIDLPTPKR